MLETKIHTIYMRAAIYLTFVLISNFVSAQNRAIYKSEVDDLLTVRTISVLPIFDNMRGIYSRPVESQLIEYLNKSHRWEFSEITNSGPVLSPDEINSDPEQLKGVATGITADAFLAAGVIKGPSGISIRMGLYLTKDKKLISQENTADFQRFDVEAVQKQTLSMLENVLKKIPYAGIVTSRQGTRVTVNLGRRDGIENDQVITVIQIIKVTRHPKFNFIVSTEKEVLGKIKLLKVDDTLSFGRVVTEKESGAIQINAKIAGLDSVSYTNTDSISENQDSAEAYSQTPEGQISFGKNPSSWVPQRKPTFGMVGARLGLGLMTENVSSASSLSARDPYYPMFALEGEIWMTPTWSMHGSMRQGVIKTDNPRSGGSPSTLEHSLSSYDFLIGYNMRLGPSINSPKIEGLFGFSTYRKYVDESTPAGLTTKSYSGIKMGVGGGYPLGENSPISVGANLFFIFNANLKESPSSSGSGDHTINTFGGYVDKQLTINLKARAALDFELYSTDFTSGSNYSASQKHTTLSVGMFYLF